MSFIAISDLHISGPEDPLYESLVALFRERVGPGDIVVLGGDLFDLFVGNKRIFTAKYHRFLQVLEESAGRGVEIHYIEGNHDFHLREVFENVAKMKVHAKDVCLEIDEKRFYIAHGDMVDHSDYRYRILRSFFRSPFMKMAIQAMPGIWLDKIGNLSSKKSRAGKPTLPSHLPAHKMEVLRKVYRSYAAEKLSEGFDFVVLGHCHDLDEMSFRIGARMGQYINVGYPRAHGSFLTWGGTDEKIQREKLPYYGA